MTSEASGLQFTAEVWTWRGPAPFYFVTVPPQACEDIKAAAKFVTYGWGMIPVRVCIGQTEFKTSLWPKDGAYVVPLKVKVRRAEAIEEGANITVELHIGH